MQAINLEDTIRSDIMLLNSVRKTAKLNIGFDGSFYTLYSGKKQLWYGNLNEVNAILKALCVLWGA